MFSGIVEELGRVKNILERGRVRLLEIQAVKVSEDTKIGDSIAVNGVCLTVVNNKNSILSFEAMPETMSISNLGLLKRSDFVNLECSLKVGDRLSGHFVLGHVDCMGLILKKGYRNSNLSFEIGVAVKFMNLIVPKASVAVDGISLTVAEKKNVSFSVYVIPHTLKNTTLGLRNPSDKVNIEFDILLKKGAIPPV